MLTEKLAQDIALATQAKLQNVKTAGLSRQQIAAILGGLGIGGSLLAAPAIAQAARDAGTASALPDDGSLQDLLGNTNNLMDMYHSGVNQANGLVGPQLNAAGRAAVDANNAASNLGVDLNFARSNSPIATNIANTLSNIGR